MHKHTYACTGQITEKSLRASEAVLGGLQTVLTSTREALYLEEFVGAEFVSMRIRMRVCVCTRLRSLEERTASYCTVKNIF